MRLTLTALSAIAALALLLTVALGERSEPAVPEGTATGSTGLDRDTYRPPPGKPVRGVVLVIHGGGWQGGEPRLMQAIEPDAERLARWGYISWSIDYRSGRNSLGDVIDWYRLIRDRYPRQPVCVKGTSAGGHLALMLAVRTPIRCVINESGPTDLLRLRFPTVEQFFPRPRTRRTFSPLGYAETEVFAGTRILIAHLRSDPVVPFSHSQRFARASDSRLVALPAGEVPFVHGAADRLALARYRQLERAFLDAAMRAQR